MYEIHYKYSSASQLYQWLIMFLFCALFEVVLREWQSLN